MERSSNNVVELTGNLGRDPEVKEVGKGRKVVHMSVATSESYTNRNGERVTDTQWHTVVGWGDLATKAGEQLRKGSRVNLRGRLVHRNYEGKDGQKRYVSEVVMNEFQLVSKPETEGVSNS